MGLERSSDRRRTERSLVRVLADGVAEGGHDRDGRLGERTCRLAGVDAQSHGVTAAPRAA